ncbi:hypothetical protein EOA23_14410 [Mesorhizobium sp. M2A.F.Ca.ET.042.01.1.1]|uniref:hypothetical protein n=1 Tax=Mesorhizobium sp. M2A.F.Ca.ET.042.01.1.1 TaxID=2496745 RepID=UPI000FCCB19C|nr:hypothetical protein [Mesorhizobium sp. M2A.F.Ca.ET.042.01.1.1]RUX28931.1 hypothetical protein EOA23_14410 [Mesorhizobium sp. M2A.F.Ca.ET.042.01.1.1]
MAFHDDSVSHERDDSAPGQDKLLFLPNISINGLIDDETVSFFLGRLETVRKNGQDMIMELNTSGGDADAARRMALEVRLFRRHSGRDAFCVGKTKVYSAGVTIFAAFPTQDRFLTEDAVLLVHERRMETSIALNGPIRSCIQIVREQLALLENRDVWRWKASGNLSKAVRSARTSFTGARRRIATSTPPRRSVLE